MSAGRTLPGGAGAATASPVLTIEGTDVKLPSWASYVSGVCGGVSGCIVGHPFDTLKVEMQTNQQAGKQSLYQAWKNVKDSGGAMRGLAPALAMNVMIYSTLLGVYDNAKALIARNTGDGVLLPTPVVAAMAGVVSGVAITPIVCPLEVLKCRAQASTSQGSTSVLAMARPLESLRTLSTGFKVTMLRCTVGNAAYFGAYEWVMDRKHNEVVHPMRVVTGSALAGVAYWTAAMPIDVIKSRLQTGAQPASGVKAAGVVHMMRDIVVREGLVGLWRGWQPAVLRAVPHNIAVMATYEAVQVAISGVLRLRGPTDA